MADSSDVQPGSNTGLGVRILVCSGLATISTIMWILYPHIDIEKTMRDLILYLQ